MPTFCHSCGSNLVDGAAFCSACGTRVEPNRKSDPLRSAIGAQNNQHELAIEAARKSDRPVRIGIIALVVVVLLALFFAFGRGSDSGTDHLAPIVKGPDYNEPVKATPKSTADVTAIRHTEAPAVVPNPQPSVTMPEDEMNFIRAVQQGQAAFRVAPNEMAQGGTRSQRRAALCRSLRGLSTSGWVGRIEKLSSNSDGKGVLEISLADSIRVETWNNDLSDASDHTLIDPTSPLFATLSQDEAA
jgi:hypothetical protein